LSKRYEVPVEMIQKLNNMTNNDLKIGQVLIIK
jgi:LysM repeat protein